MAHPENSPFRAGSKVSSGHRLERSLGQTSSGERWQAVDIDGRRVMLLIVAGAEVARATKVLEAIADLAHANLILPEDFWTEKNHLFVLTQLTRAGTLQNRLASHIKENRPGIPKPELIGYFQDLARCLDYLHSHQVIHRDVQPDNVILEKNSVKLTHPGLADSSAEGGGTAWKFVAPERLAGEALTASDQYSLAVSWIELRLGRPLYPQAETAVKFREAQALTVPNLDELDITEQQVLRKALSSDPNRRFPSCGNFVQALAVAKESKLKKLPPKTLAGPARNRRFGFTPRRLLIGGGYGLMVASIVLMVLAAKERGSLHAEVKAFLEKTDERRFVNAVAKIDEAGLFARLTSGHLRADIGEQWRKDARKQLNTEKRWKRDEFVKTEKSLGDLLKLFPNQHAATANRAEAKRSAAVLDYLDKGQYQQAADLLPVEGPGPDDQPKLFAFLEDQIKHDWTEATNDLSAKNPAAARVAFAQIEKRFKFREQDNALAKNNVAAMNKEMGGLLAKNDFAAAQKSFAAADPATAKGMGQQLESLMASKTKAMMKDEKGMAEAMAMLKSMNKDFPAGGKAMERSMLESLVPKGQDQFDQERKGPAGAGQYVATQERLDTLQKNFPKSEAVGKLRQEIFQTVRKDAERAFKEGRHADSLQHYASARTFAGAEAERAAIDKKMTEVLAAQVALNQDRDVDGRLQSTWARPRPGNPALRCVR